MSTETQSTFIISREDRAEDPKTIILDALRIGRVPDSHVWLNHPAVSRLHAGINELDGYFYLINLSASSATALNGRAIPFDEAEALTVGDEIQIGPYFLRIDSIDQTNSTLGISVTSQIALRVGEREALHKLEVYKRQQAADRPSGPLTRRSTGPLNADDDGKQSMPSGTHTSDVSNTLKVFWSKRTREKAGRPSPLHPRTPQRLGKAQFNWVPSRDLIRPWPFAIFLWAVIVVGALSVLAAFGHKNAFAPKAVSDPHTRTAFVLLPEIAKQINGNSCTSCHAIGVRKANKEKMNANCAACHNTKAFVATVIPAHRDAGITCTTCHTEHRGESFRPLNAALQSCNECHNDHNKNLYNGKGVYTPHGGTFGYPVKDKLWIWTGIDGDELAQKPGVVAFLKENRVNSTQTQAWRNAQFHGIHVDRVRVVEGIDGVLNEKGVSVLSCSSCHKSGYMGTKVDRTYPRTTCGRCHNAEVFNEPTSSPNKTEIPSCTSCHVQHIRDIRWAASLRFAQAEASTSPEVWK